MRIRSEKYEIVIQNEYWPLAEDLITRFIRCEKCSDRDAEKIMKELTDWGIPHKKTWVL